MTPEQRERVIDLLHRLNTVVTLVPRTRRHYPNSDPAALGLLTGCWQPVATAYQELAATVRPSGEEHAA